MKKYLWILLIPFLLFTAGCKEKANLQLPQPEKELEVREVSDTREQETLGILFQRFYENPMVTKNTDFSFFGDEKNQIAFAVYALAGEQEPYSGPATLLISSKDVEKKILELFGTEIRHQDPGGQITLSETGVYQVRYQKEEKPEQPIVEGIFTNGSVVIIKAGLYFPQANEAGIIQNQKTGMITMTLEKSQDGYLIIDYLFEETEK